MLRQVRNTLAEPVQYRAELLRRQLQNNFRLRSIRMFIKNWKCQLLITDAKRGHFYTNSK